MRFAWAQVPSMTTSSRASSSSASATVSSGAAPAAGQSRSGGAVASRIAGIVAASKLYPILISTDSRHSGSSGTVEKWRRRNSFGCWRTSSFVFVAIARAGSASQTQTDGGRAQRGHVGRAFTVRTFARRSEALMLRDICCCCCLLSMDRLCATSIVVRKVMSIILVC